MDFQDLNLFPAEPFKIKSVEVVKMITKEEREVVMEQLRPVSKKERVIFPIMVTVVVSLILPPAAPLVGMLMLGNLFRESLLTDRLSKTSQNELINIVTKKLHPDYLVDYQDVINDYLLQIHKTSDRIKTIEALPYEID